ncbi:nuclear factor interleukin-3-regulated protein-like [Erpetoichthys calabaricus]|uniref:Nuclear factor, interleukin 3 regulated, member 6 n=1 Tax=Erpetoichthys calabaricus TaxID=27687 RepID=A0A8C4XI50_ERPCA|nr:nuclear factor interleukin-3-regulated protein-like [Erpetoichthys calabaricus]
MSGPMLGSAIPHPASEFLQEVFPPLHVPTSLTFTEEAASILTTNGLLARSLLGPVPAKRKGVNGLRRKREFIPDDKKDNGYWDKRKKNNEAAKRSREKRRVSDMVLENRVLALLEENARLRTELLALKFRFGLVKDHSEVAVHSLSCPVSGPQQGSAKYHPGPAGHSSSFPYLAQPPCPAEGRSHIHPQGFAGRPLSDNRETPNFSEDSGFSTPGGSRVSSPLFFDDRLSEHGRYSPPGFEGQMCARISDLETESLETIGEGNCPSEVVPTGRLDPGDGIKSLPHKLRFKAAGGPECVEPTPESFMPQGKTLAPTVCRGPVEEQTYTCVQQRGPLDRRGMQSGWHRQGVGSKGQMSVDSGYCARHRAPSGNEAGSPSDSSALKSQLAFLSEEVAQLKRLFSHHLLPKAL